MMFHHLQPLIAKGKVKAFDILMFMSASVGAD